MAAILTNAGSHARPVGALAERLDELQRDADAGEVLVRIGAVVALGVDHGQRRRQRAVGLVMIGDDEVDAEVARALRGLGAADAAVDRDDQPHAFGVQAIDRRPAAGRSRRAAARG